MRLCLRPVVNAEDAFDYAFELGRNLQHAFSAAISVALKGVKMRLRAKGLAEGTDGAAEYDRAARRFHMHNLQAILSGKCTDRGNVFSTSTVL